MQQIIYLEETDSTNNWAKRHFEGFGAVGAVVAHSQTGGRGRLGRAWQDTPGQALYYSAVLKRPLAHPAGLPLYVSLAAAKALRREFDAPMQVKWPNDLLLNGKKLVGILCEGVPGGYVCGIGVNLCQPAAYFSAVGLTHATSLAAEGVEIENAAMVIPRLAQALTLEFGSAMDEFAEKGFAPLREIYRAACVNIGRRVWFAGGEGVAVDVDEAGRLIVGTDEGEQIVFTGEVSVKGIYGQL